MDPMGDNHGSYGSLMVNVGKYTIPMGSLMGFIPNPPTVRLFPSSKAASSWDLDGASEDQVVEAATQALAASLNLDPSAVAAIPAFFGWLVLMWMGEVLVGLLGDLGECFFVF